jgi:hypothetical protein
MRSKQRRSPTSTAVSDEPLQYSFSEELFVWNGAQSSWYFIRLPLELSEDLRQQVEGLTNGFGSVRVEAMIEATVFRTSLFPESATRRYLLPVKKAVRRAAEIESGDHVDVSLSVLLNEHPRDPLR